VWRPSVHLLGDLLLRSRIWRSTSVCVAMKASDGVMGGGGGKSPLPLAPNPWESYAWFPQSEMRALVSYITKRLLGNDDKYDYT
jgi:hypothetical protein